MITESRGVHQLGLRHQPKRNKMMKNGKRIFGVTWTIWSMMWVITCKSRTKPSIEVFITISYIVLSMFSLKPLVADFYKAQ